MIYVDKGTGKCLETGYCLEVCGQKRRIYGIMQK